MRPRHGYRIRARILRRPPQLGAADALLRAPLPLHRIQCARLSAVGRAEVAHSRYSQTIAVNDIADRHAASQDCAKRTSSAARWVRARRSASALLTRARVIGDHRRRRRGLESFDASGFPAQYRSEREKISRARRAGDLARERRCRRPHSATEQGPARLRRIPALANGALGARVSPIRSAACS